MGVDHDFGPKDGLIGGDGAGERNVIGRTRYEGIEFSHGWDRHGHDNGPWRIRGNRVIGNWIGFRMDGHYDMHYRSGWKAGTSDSAGVHVWDGANDNVIARNHVASYHDGIRMRTRQAHGNQVIENVIGISPRGESAPMDGWGIDLQQGLRDATLRGNVIRGAASGGVGLLNANVTGVVHQPDDRGSYPRTGHPAGTQGSCRREPPSGRSPGRVSEDLRELHDGARDGTCGSDRRGLPFQRRHGQGRDAQRLPWPRHGDVERPLACHGQAPQGW